MKLKHLFKFLLSTINHQPSTIAVFGQARLIRLGWWHSARSGEHQLIGGTAADRAAAFEWVSLFAHEIVFKTPRSREREIPFSASDGETSAVWETAEGIRLVGGTKCRASGRE